MPKRALHKSSLSNWWPKSLTTVLSCVSAAALLYVAGYFVFVPIEVRHTLAKLKPERHVSAIKAGTAFNEAVSGFITPGDSFQDADSKLKARGFWCCSRDMSVRIGAKAYRYDVPFLYWPFVSVKKYAVVISANEFNTVTEVDARAGNVMGLW